MDSEKGGKRSLIISIIVVLLIIICFTVYWQFFRGEDVVQDTQPVVETPVTQTETRTITAIHQFSNGKHIIAGQTDLPTPCHILSDEVTVAESFPERVLIAFQSKSQDAQICAQVITSTKFKIEFNASQNAIIQATWNGEPAILNLIPASASDNLDNYEIFIKG